MTEGFLVCDMGFYVYEATITNNHIGIEYPMLLKPFPKPTSRRYASFTRFTDKIKRSREDISILVDRFSSRYLTQIDNKE